MILLKNEKGNPCIYLSCGTNTPDMWTLDRVTMKYFASFHELITFRRCNQMSELYFKSLHFFTNDALLVFLLISLLQSDSLAPL